MTAIQTTTKKWGTQTWIGKRFGLSAVVVGRILTTAGLKQGPEATSKAVLTGHAKRCYTSDLRPYWMWDMDAVGEVVEVALVHHGGPPIEKLIKQVGEMLKDADAHRAEGNDVIADLLEEEAYAGVPPGLARVVRRRLDH